MRKIKAKVSDKQDHALLCAVTDEPFKQKPGLAFYFEDEDAQGGKIERPVSSRVANSAGFTLDEALAPPSDVTSKAELTGWLHSLGLESSGANYRKLYGDFSPLYPDLGRNNNGSKINL